MKPWQHYLIAAAGTGLIVVILALSSAGPAIAQGAFQPLRALIVNDPSHPVPVLNVDTPSREPISLHGELHSNGGIHYDTDLLFTVPTGKRLVLEDAAASIQVPTGQNAYFLIQKLAANNVFLGARPLTVTYQVTLPVNLPVTDFLEAGEPVLMYFDAGQQVEVQLLRSSAAGNAVATAVLSGYLVDVPTP